MLMHNVGRCLTKDVSKETIASPSPRGSFNDSHENVLDGRKGRKYKEKVNEELKTY